ncbi:unnamed protein product [Durusdinium trenchii]|uniref:ABM domain-containing protein n=2 Tax=Durusdinium trenchii TaxID=1381693 RepID=A0ABP0NC96_9DINO
MAEIEIMTELKVSAKKPASFYVRAAATFLRGTRDKEPVNELRVTALGSTIDVAVTVAVRMERDGIGKIATIHTDYVQVSRGQSPQISFRLLRILPPAILREVEVKPEFVEEFLKVMTALAAGARAEAGCLRYDLLRAQESSCKFLAYEVFISKKAFESHAAAPYAKALEAFEKDSRSPIVSTSLSEVEVMDFQRSSPAPAESPTVVILEVGIKGSCIPEFTEVMSANCRGSRNEVGCLRFDLLRSTTKADTFMSYEAFESPDSLEIHKDMPYTKAWGAFQYGDQKPVTSKRVVKYNVMDLHAPELLS